MEPESSAAKQSKIKLIIREVFGGVIFLTLIAGVVWYIVHKKPLASITSTTKTRIELQIVDTFNGWKIYAVKENGKTVDFITFPLYTSPDEPDSSRSSGTTKDSTADSTLSWWELYQSRFW